MFYPVFSFVLFIIITLLLTWGAIKQRDELIEEFPNLKDISNYAFVWSSSLATVVCYTVAAILTAFICLCLSLIGI